jgi:inosine-uridine nucleoside N-ribohydrolase
MSPPTAWRRATRRSGSTAYLPSKEHPVESAAARDLVERAGADRDGPLYVVAIGAPTKVSSAILMDPEITRRIVVVWLGGNPHDWPSAGEFNLRQDVPASQVIFDSGVPLVQIPGLDVAEMLRTTLPEIERWVKGRGGDKVVSGAGACRGRLKGFSGKERLAFRQSEG